MSQIVMGKLPESIPPNEKCDACPAMARLMVLVGDRLRIPLGPLSFCFHHGNKHEVGLFARTNILDVLDNRVEYGATIGRDMLGQDSFN